MRFQLDCSRRAVVAFQRTIAEADLTGEAAAIEVPVTIIHGTGMPPRRSTAAHAATLRSFQGQS